MPRKSPEKILVVDVESTCWNRLEDYKESEIIEIGMAVLNLGNMKIGDNRSIYVKNEISDISTFCTELTGITQDIIDAQGISFSNALDVFYRDYPKKEYYFASYGNYDRKMFEKQCKRTNTVYPFNDTHINVKTLHRLNTALPAEEGMAEALIRLNLPLQGVHHSGKDDAYNIAVLLKEHLMAARDTLTN